MKASTVTKAAACVLLAPMLSLATPAHAKKISACLITKTDTDPYFVTMRKGAEQEAKKLGVELKSYAGRYMQDNQSQVDAVESCVADGVNGILITPSDSSAIVPTIEKARKAGVLVIALDTTLEPASAADGTFATDNFKAGELIGKWAKARLGPEKAKNAHIAFLDLAASQPSVGVQRDQGFMTGFGIDIKNPNKWGDETDPRIVGHAISNGAEDGGRKAMEDLLQKDPRVNVAYTINEPAAAGAYQALKSVGMQKKVLLTSIDGGCPGVKNVRDGTLGATSQQYPLKMATMGIEAIVKYVKTGKKPHNSPGLDFYNTGVQLVTDHPVKGIPSISSKKGLELCWG